jgi:hypothetical protein
MIGSPYLYLDAESMCRFADRLVQTEATPPRLSLTCVQGTEETSFRPLVEPYPGFFLAPSTGSLGFLSPPRSSLLALVPISSFLVSRRTRARGSTKGMGVAPKLPMVVKMVYDSCGKAGFMEPA